MAKSKKSKLQPRMVFRMERTMRGDRPVLGEVCADVPFSRAKGSNAVKAVEAEGRVE
jgi:hypothetical protein